MGITDGNIAGDRDWVQERIETRVRRGEQWRREIEKHKLLARAFRYVRILGGGFRPVSISEANPCGHLRDKDGGEIKSCESLEGAIAKAEAASATDRKPGADKAEQRVQAFLIRAGLKNVDQFGRFDQELPDFSDVFNELIFVTDELSMNNGKVRADIVALGGKGGQYFPVFIELKNSRSLNELRIQLDNAYDLLWKNERAREPFSRFLSAVSGVTLQNIRQDENAARKMIIWPKSSSGEEHERVDEARQNGFLIVDFEIVDRYVFSRRAP